MFDIGFSELLLFGVIALIVLGPEKLPQAARTAGQWYSKIRRTVATLQSEIEAELDLAETREQMQKELAKIRQTEADMKREMEQLRGSMQEFESSQNKSLQGLDKTPSDTTQYTTDDSDADRQAVEDKYAYDNRLAADGEPISAQPTSQDEQKSVMMTRPWESMWFRLGAYDKNRRLPAPPYLPNYKADTLLYTQVDEPSSNHKESAK